MNNTTSKRDMNILKSILETIREYKISLGACDHIANYNRYKTADGKRLYMCGYKGKDKKGKKYFCQETITRGVFGEIQDFSNKLLYPEKQPKNPFLQRRIKYTKFERKMNSFKLFYRQLFYHFKSMYGKPI